MIREQKLQCRPGKYPDGIFFCALFLIKVYGWTWGRGKKLLPDRFFPASPNPITLFQTFFWHFYFLCKQKRKVPFKFKKIVYYQYPVRIGNSAFFYQVNLNFILIQIVLQTVFVAVFHRRNIEEKFEPFAEMIAVPVAQR